MNKKDKQMMIGLLNVHYSFYMDYMQAGNAEKAAKQYIYYHGMEMAYSNLLKSSHEYIELKPDGSHEIKK